MSVRAVPLTGLDLRLGGEGWAFARQNRSRIDAHWQEQVALNPKLWNGEVLICNRADVEDGVLRGRFSVCDYASFVAWRNWNWPDRESSNCFGVPAVISSDNALLFGVMGEHTLNRGLCYPPSGSLEPQNVRSDGSVDIFGSIATELKEETGLEINIAKAGRLLAIFDGQKLAIVQELRFPLTFGEMEEIFQRHQATEEHPELSAIRAIRSRSESDSTMPLFAHEIIRQFLGDSR